MNRKLLFIHVPKTAGTSLKLALGEGLGFDNILFGSTREEILKIMNASSGVLDKFDFIGGHLTIAMFEKVMAKLPKIDWYPFACLREPHRRLYSLCNYYASGKEKDYAFFESINYCQRLEYLEKDTSLLPMCSWVGSSLDAEGAIAKVHKHHIRLYPLELTRDLLFSRLSAIFKFPIKIPQSNRAEYGKANFYDFMEALVNRPVLQKLLHEDIKLYNYAISQCPALSDEDPHFFQ